MSDRDELLRLTRQLKEHLGWLERGGAVGVPRVEEKAATPRPSVAPRTASAAPAGTAAATNSPTPSAASVASHQISADSSVPGAPVGRRGLELVRESLGECTRCKLASGRTNLVYGVGNPDAPLVFVGEAPGAEEDRTGEPFVGAAGQLLTKMILAMGLTREDVYIANIIKCRPPGNRNPEPDEIAECEPFLIRQLAAIRPRMIVCLGKFAAQCLLRSDAPISRLRGRFQSYQGIPLMPTFHPAYLLRNPPAKREVWADLQLVMAELDRLGIARRT